MHLLSEPCSGMSNSVIPYSGSIRQRHYPYMFCVYISNRVASLARMIELPQERIFIAAFPDLAVGASRGSPAEASRPWKEAGVLVGKSRTPQQATHGSPLRR